MLNDNKYGLNKYDWGLGKLWLADCAAALGKYGGLVLGISGVVGEDVLPGNIFFWRSAIYNL